LCLSGLILAGGPPSKSLQRDIIQAACSALDAAQTISTATTTASTDVSSAAADALDAVRRGLETVARSAPSLSKVLAICHAATASAASRPVDASLVTAMAWAQTIADIPEASGPLPPALVDKASHVIALAFCSCMHESDAVRSSGRGVLVKMLEFVTGEKVKESIVKECDGLVSSVAAAADFAHWSPLQPKLLKIIDHVTSTAGSDLSRQIVSAAFRMLCNFPCAM